MITIVTGSAGIIAGSIILWLIRKDRLHVNHGMGWMAVAIAFVFLGFSPEIIDKVALLLGVAYPPVLALMIAIIVLVIKVLLMDIERSHIEVRNQRLIQRIAILEAQFKKMQKQLPPPQTDDSTDPLQSVK